MKSRVLLDTDIGGDIDDAICLAYLLCEPNCDLLGITTVCGEASIRASVASAICISAGRGDVPIVAGHDLPLRPIPLYPTPEGAGALERWEHDKFGKEDAAAFLYEKIRKYPHEITLIAIGCMTNVADLFSRHPDACALLKGLYTMNGYFGEKPLPEPWWNWNSWADPLASEIVFASRVPINRAVTLEVTEQLSAPAAEAEALLPSNSALMRAVYDFGGAWLSSSRLLTLHDPLAAVCLFHPEICAFERGYVRVETKTEESMGSTEFAANENGNVEITRSVDKQKFYNVLSQALC